MGLAITPGPILLFSYVLYQSSRLVFIAKPVHKWIEDRTWLMTKVWVGSYVFVMLNLISECMLGLLIAFCMLLMYLGM